MNIALMSHDRKKELMVQFCIAYCGILSKHTICATNTTGKLVAEATGLPVSLFLSHAHGGSQQIGARIAYNEIDMVLFFSDPQSNDLDADLNYITRLCDQYNIPFATNVATAEMLIHGLDDAAAVGIRAVSSCGVLCAAVRAGRHRTCARSGRRPLFTLYGTDAGLQPGRHASVEPYLSAI